MTQKTRPAILLIGGLFFLLIDQGCKWLARTSPGWTHYLIRPWVGWEYLANPGIAFSIPFPNALLIILSPLLIFFLCLAFSRTKKQAIRCGILAIMLGALSNFIDRVLFGVTIDYLRVFTSVLNLADVAIILGALTIVISEQPAHQRQS